MLVEEDGERLYKVVTQHEIDSTLAGEDPLILDSPRDLDYQRQKPLGAQPGKERKNPFTETLSQESNPSDKSQALSRNSKKDKIPVGWQRLSSAILPRSVPHSHPPDPGRARADPGAEAPLAGREATPSGLSRSLGPLPRHPAARSLHLLVIPLHFLSEPYLNIKISFSCSSTMTKSGPLVSRASAMPLSFVRSSCLHSVSHAVYHPRSNLQSQCFLKKLPPL